MPRTKIRFEKIKQLRLMPGQIVIEDVPEENPLHIPVEDKKIVIAGRGSARNPKRNLEPPAIYLVRETGPGVEVCKQGDWVMLKYAAVCPDRPEMLSSFYIEEGSFALIVEDSVAGTVKSLASVG